MTHQMRWPSIGWEGEGSFLLVHEQFLFLSFDELLGLFSAGISYPHWTQ